MDDRTANISPNVRRRRAQLLFLVAAVLMLVLGMTVFRNSLQGVGLVAYYLTCMLLTLAAMLLAVREMRDIRRQNREERIGLAEKAFDNVSAEVKEARDRRRARR